MELVFSTLGVVGQGESPDFIQFPKTEGQLFYLANEELYGKPTEKLHGEFSSPIWLDPIMVLNDTIKQLELTPYRTALLEAIEQVMLINCLFMNLHLKWRIILKVVQLNIQWIRQ